MKMWTRKPGRLLACIAGLAFALTCTPAESQDQILGDGIVSKELKKFIPYRKYQPVAGKAIGVMVSEAQPVLSTEGRSGPLDEVCFAVDGCSYRWVYVQSPNGTITNLQVQVGNQLGQIKVYPRLDLATAKSVKPMGMNNLFALVEVEVNDGLGSPPLDSFVATKIKVLDGTPQYPIKVEEVIGELKKDYAKYRKEEEQKFETEMTKAQKAALKDQKPTGPRSKNDLMYITWMSDDSTLQVFFLSKWTDGHYTFVGGGANFDPPPFPLPVPPGKKLPPPPAAPGGDGLQPVAFFPPPPPPRPMQFKTGTTFGIEFGRIYIVGKDGKINQKQDIPVQSFQQVLPIPPGAGFGGPRPVPLPVPLPPVKKDQ